MEHHRRTSAQDVLGGSYLSLYLAYWRQLYPPLRINPESIHGSHTGALQKRRGSGRCRFLSLKLTNQLGSGDQAQAIQPTTDQLSPFEGRDQGQMPAIQQDRSQADPQAQTLLASTGDKANPLTDDKQADDLSTEQAQVADTRNWRHPRRARPPAARLQQACPGCCA